MTTFVSTFIGLPSMNLLDVNDARNWTLARDSNIPAGAVTIGIRPEDIAAAEPPGKADRGFSANVRVVAVEFVGAESYIHGVLEEGSPLLLGFQVVPGWKSTA